jgi:hypothetical protein
LRFALTFPIIDVDLPYIAPIGVLRGANAYAASDHIYFF